MEKVKKLKRRKLIGILISVLFSPGLLFWLYMENGMAFVLAVICTSIFILGISIYSNSKNKLLSLCTSCGTSLEGAAYDIEEIGREENKYGDVIAIVEFVADCPECGTKKIFTKKYTVYHAARYAGNGRRTSNARLINVQRQIEKDAKKYFGH